MIICWNITYRRNIHPMGQKAYVFAGLSADIYMLIIKTNKAHPAYAIEFFRSFESCLIYSWWQRLYEKVCNNRFVMQHLSQNKNTLATDKCCHNYLCEAVKIQGVNFISYMDHGFLSVSLQARKWLLCWLFFSVVNSLRIPFSITISY